jgi:hypothetical protein
VEAVAVAAALVDDLRREGFGEVEARPVVAGIEDVFMELMIRPRETSA